MAEIKNILAISVVSILLCSCAKGPQAEFNKNLKETVINLDVENNSKNYKLMYIADTHINSFNDEIADEYAEKTKQRVENFKFQGIPTREQFSYYIDKVNSVKPDLLILGADIVDTNSDANISDLKSALEKLQVPFVYLRSDHDNEAYWLKVDDKNHRTENQKSIDPKYNENMYYNEFDDFIVLNWNNSHQNLSPDGLTVAKDAISKNKPIILSTHVPLQSKVDSTLVDKCNEILSGNRWMWGRDCAYYPNDITQEFLDLVLDTKNNFKLVLGGHLHFAWDGNLVEGVRQVVTEQAYTGNYLTIIIK